VCLPGRPDPGAEAVQLYDGRGRPAGTATRRDVRTRNLTHAATSVVLRDGWGRVFVHRRTDTKDVFPGRYDFAAGGVVAAGEDPGVAAVRELAEELGVTGVPLEAIGTGHYGDEHTDYWGHCFTATWDGPVRLQPEEVAWGGWWTVDRLVAALDDPDWPVVPDSAALLGGWVRRRAADRRAVAEQGWDSVAEVVEGRWLDRTPRREEVRAALAVEAAVLPRVAPHLPLAVPVPLVLDGDPWRVRHRLVPGAAADPGRLTATDGAAVGAFLRALHDRPAADWADTGIGTEADRLPVLDDLEHRVLPLLPPDVRDRGRALLDRCRAAADGPRALRHGDLGPEHVLVHEGRVHGVIDWADVAVGDPALDLAWTVHGTPDAFRDALVTTYGPTREELARGRDWHLLGPWYEAHRGLTGGPEEYVASGTDGAVRRLRVTP
jgi:aminoglycoside phosphotransferase (APT) family kinase protein